MYVFSYFDENMLLKKLYSYNCYLEACMVCLIRILFLKLHSNNDIIITNTIFKAITEYVIQIYSFIIIIY